MTRRKREGGNVTLHPMGVSRDVATAVANFLPYCSAAFKAAVERAATTSGGKITVTCRNLPTAFNKIITEKAARVDKIF